MMWPSISTRFVSTARSHAGFDKDYLAKTQGTQRERYMNMKIFFVFDSKKSVLGALGVLARDKSFLYEIYR